MQTPTRTALLAAPAALALLAAASPAQGGVSASESYIELAGDLVSAGGVGTSAASGAELALPSTPAGPVASSESYSALDGLVWTEPAVSGSGPVLLSVLPDTGHGSGNQPVSLIGVNFSAPGAGETEVLFGGLSSSSVLVADDTRIEVLTPVGVNALGNPLGAVGVEVRNELGSNSLEQGFTYAPSLRLTASAHVGGVLSLEHVGAPGGLWLLATGAGVPGHGVPIEPFSGSLEILLGLQVIVPLSPAGPSGLTGLQLAVPNNPALAGSNFVFQGLSLDSLAPLVGSFTNALSVEIQS